jgi:hypothetical protein
MYGLLVLIWLAPYKLKAESDRFKKTHKEFAIQTTNEIDELFPRVEAIGPTWQEAGLRCEGGHLPLANGSVTLIRNHGNDVTPHISGDGYRESPGSPSELPSRSCRQARHQDLRAGCGYDRLICVVRYLGYKMW